MQRSSEADKVLCVYYVSVYEMFMNVYEFPCLWKNYEMCMKHYEMVMKQSLHATSSTCNKSGILTIHVHYLTYFLDQLYKDVVWYL